MDQEVLAGVGNVYRAEVLFRHRMHPLRPGRTLRVGQWRALWEDLVVLMAEGVKTGTIDTVRPEHTPEAMGRSAPTTTTAERSTSTAARARRATCAGPGSGPKSSSAAISSGVRIVNRGSDRAPYSERQRPDGTTTMSGAPKSRSVVPARARAAWKSLDEPGAPAKGPLLGLVVFTLVLAVGTIGFPDYVPLNVVVLPLILSSLFLSPRYVPVFLGFLALVTIASIPRMVAPTNRTWVAIVVILSLIAVVLVTSNRRARLGVAGAKGESMLVDLRDRIQRYGRLPELRSSGSPRPHCGRRAARSSPATSSSRPPPRAAWTWPWSTCPARATRRPPGPCCCRGPSAA